MGARTEKIQGLENVVFREGSPEMPGALVADAVAVDVEVAQGLVGPEGLADGLAASVSQAVVIELELAQRNVGLENSGKGSNAVGPNLVRIELQRAEVGRLDSHSGHKLGAFIAKIIPAQVEGRERRVGLDK